MVHYKVKIDKWLRDGAGFAEQAEQRVQRVTAKAWRFAGEMDEIAATFAEAGMPGDFHSAAADLYRRLAGFKGCKRVPELAEVLDALLHKSGNDCANSPD